MVEYNVGFGQLLADLVRRGVVGTPPVGERNHLLWWMRNSLWDCNEVCGLLHGPLDSCTLGARFKPCKMGKPPSEVLGRGLWQDSSLMGAMRLDFIMVGKIASYTSPSRSVWMVTLYRRCLTLVSVSQTIGDDLYLYLAAVNNTSTCCSADAKEGARHANRKPSKSSDALSSVSQAWHLSVVVSAGWQCALFGWPY